MTPLDFRAVRISRVPLYTKRPLDGGIILLEARRRDRARARRQTAQLRARTIWLAVLAVAVLGLGLATDWQAARAIAWALTRMGPLG